MAGPAARGRLRSLSPGPAPFGEGDACPLALGTSRRLPAGRIDRRSWSSGSGRAQSWSRRHTPRIATGIDLAGRFCDLQTRASSPGAGRRCLAICPLGSLAARPWSAVEVRPRQPRTGDHGLVLPAARRVGRIEPLCEELTQPRLTGTALHRQPLVEGGFELRLADAGPAVYLLQLLQHPVEVDRP